MSYTLNWISVRLKNSQAFLRIWWWLENTVTVSGLFTGLWDGFILRNSRDLELPPQPSWTPVSPNPACACICWLPRSCGRRFLLGGLGTQTENIFSDPDQKLLTRCAQLCLEYITNTPCINCSRLEFMLNRKIN